MTITKDLYFIMSLGSMRCWHTIAIIVQQKQLIICCSFPVHC